MRFDDSLSTVLAGDLAGQAGAQAGWRQLVDLLGRGRVAADPPTLARLRALREDVPVEVRAASARALAFTQPPEALVELFVADEIAVAAPVLRSATLDDAAWLALLPRLDSRGRSVLRHRRDLSATVRRGLDAFGSADFVLDHERPATTVPAREGLVTRSEPTPPPAPALPPTPSPREEERPPRFEIAELIARIDGFTRDRPEPAASPTAPVSRFLFETDASGTIHWVEGVARGSLIGRSLVRAGSGAMATDAVFAGALRRRDRFADARLEIGGDLPAAGSWRLSGRPLFDEASGRFAGMRGVGHRARADQRAETAAARVLPAIDSLRQLVHELRTPANAIMGFAELIESELLGPVPVHYKAQAGTIRDEAVLLVDAIEDLDTAARIDGSALDLRPGTVALAPLIDRIVADLRPLAFLRGVEVAATVDPALPPALADARAAERLVSRLLSALVAAGSPGERLAVTLGGVGGGMIALEVDRPSALDTDTEAALFSLDGVDDERPGTPLLGVGFTLRLARNLAMELGGTLAVGSARLTLRLPVASDPGVQTAAI